MIPDTMDFNELKDFLNEKVELYNRKEFIEPDPISIPHMFHKKQDIEIAGLFSALFAWGGRKTIINKSKELMQRMDLAPHDFCLNHTQAELKKLKSFVHRTFNETDLAYMVRFLQYHYKKNDSLENAFSQHIIPGDKDVYNALNGFYGYFFRCIVPYPKRVERHIAAPKKNSACKRLNMYLRWMVRKDKANVDFGLWGQITPDKLICPLDVHVSNVALKLGLVQNGKSDWKTAVSLTEELRKFDNKDPIKYDFALFGLGIMEKF